MYWYQGFIFSWVCIFYFMSVSESKAQVAFHQLILDCSEKEEIILRQYARKILLPDSNTAAELLDQIIGIFQKEGYLTVKSSEIVQRDSLFYAELQLGERYQWVTLSSGNLPVLMQEKTGYREKLFLGQPFRYNEVAHLLQKVLEVAENTGYPFASIRLADIIIENHTIRGRLDYHSGPLITFGQLVMNDSSLVKPKFFAAYLDVKSETPYSEKKVIRIAKLVEQLPYLRLTAPVSVSFQNETADLHLDIEAKRSNQLDGILSFLPNEGKNKKALITGELTMGLNNLFHRGKKLAFDWKRLQLQSQQLTVQYDHPNVAHTFLDATLGFHLLKEDTLYINRDAQIDLSYKAGAFGRMKIFTGIKSSRITATNSENLSFPDIPLGSFDLNQYGVGYAYNKLNNIQFPKQGTKFAVEASLGNKKFRNVRELKPDSVVYAPWQYTFIASLSNYRLFWKKYVLFNRVTGGALINNHLFLNDLYRIGGFNSLRGFNENFFFTNRYLLSNLEVRLLFEEKEDTQSYLFIFYDQAYLGQKTRNYVSAIYPAGIGTGVSLTTMAGIFNIAIAVGKSEHQAMNFSAAKIHFGYISRF